MCERLEEENYIRLCRYNALKSAARMLSYHNKRLEYCETVDEHYRNACYEGMSWGLCQQHYPDLREKLILDCKSLGIYAKPCLNGLGSAISEYMAKNPSYAEVFNKLILESAQQSSISGELLNASAENAGFYAGIEHFQDMEKAFTICDVSYQGLNENQKNICYKNVYFGFGYAYYSKLFSKDYNPAEKT